MSEINKNQANTPIAKHWDGAVCAAIWQNETKDGGHFYTAQFQRVFTDAKTNKARNAQSFSGTDLLKVQRLASQAYQTIQRLREQDKVGQSEEAPEAQNPAPVEQ